MTLKLFLSLGKDLISSKNLLNRHQVIQANIASHEPRIQVITERGNKMVEEGMLWFRLNWPVITVPDLWVFFNFRASFLYLLWYFYLYNFPSTWSSSNISCSEALLIINSLGFCFGLKDFLLLSFLKHIFTGYKILGWYCLSPSILKMLLPCLLTCRVSGEKSPLITIFAPLYVRSFFPLTVLSLVFTNLRQFDYSITWCSGLCFFSFAIVELLGSAFLWFFQGSFYSGTNLATSPLLRYNPSEDTTSCIIKSFHFGGS